MAGEWRCRAAVIDRVEKAIHGNGNLPLGRHQDVSPVGVGESRPFQDDRERHRRPRPRRHIDRRVWPRPGGGAGYGADLLGRPTLVA